MGHHWTRVELTRAVSTRQALRHYVRGLLGWAALVIGTLHVLLQFATGGRAVAENRREL